jgi:hypothetical protein
MEILASPEEPGQDQEHEDSKEKAARTVDRKLLDILNLHPPKQRCILLRHCRIPFEGDWRREVAQNDGGNRMQRPRVSKGRTKKAWKWTYNVDALD